LLADVKGEFWDLGEKFVILQPTAQVRGLKRKSPVKLGAKYLDSASSAE